MFPLPLMLPVVPLGVAEFVSGMFVVLQVSNSEEVMEPLLSASRPPKASYGNAPLAFSSVRLREPLRSVSSVEKLNVVLALVLGEEPLLAVAKADPVESNKTRVDAIRFFKVISWV